ncbi:MAG: hypothetical protein FD174_3692 [Geobacteraceae bacterium]|nr:MAG: hypothetical protein FD174_3692 [Geobacteraceae bacterium]
MVRIDGRYRMAFKRSELYVIKANYISRLTRISGGT